MVSSASILAAGNPSLLTAFPGWRAPTLLRAVFTTASSGVATMVAAETTPGVVATESGTDGAYSLTFPTCRRVGRFKGNVSPATPGTVGNHRHVRFDPAVAATAAAGSIVFRTIAIAGGSIVSPNDGSAVEISFWADLG